MFRFGYLCTFAVVPGSFWLRLGLTALLHHPWGPFSVYAATSTVEWCASRRLCPASLADRDSIRASSLWDPSIRTPARSSSVAGIRSPSSRGAADRTSRPSSTNKIAPRQHSKSTHKPVLSTQSAGHSFNPECHWLMQPLPSLGRGFHIRESPLGKAAQIPLGTPFTTEQRSARSLCRDFFLKKLVPGDLYRE